MSGIKQKLNIDLPLSALISQPTIRALAELIESQGTSHLWEVIVPIRRTGEKTPLFLIHGAGLNILLYQSLTKHLKADRPIYALQARGLDGKQTLNTNIPEMAGFYIDEIKKVQPKGPYYFLGFSLGGFIAYEMGRILAERGEQSYFVGAIDSVVSDAMEEKSQLKKITDTIVQIVAMPATVFWLFLKEPMAEKRKFVENKVKNISLIMRYYMKRYQDQPSEMDAPKEGEDLSAVYLNSELRIKLMASLRKYLIVPADIKLDLFRAGKATFYIRDKKDYGWTKYARKGLVQHVIPGEHSSMFAHPNDILFADILQKRLEECDLMPRNNDL